MSESSKSSLPVIALGCGVLGVVAAVWIYWLVVPGVVLGIAAVVLGWRSRRGGASEPASIAIALGLVAILLVPSVMAIANSAENWGRDCESNANPDPNC